MKVETTALSIKHIAQMYCVNGKHFADLYRNKLSGYEEWWMEELSNGFYFNPANIGPYMSLDETCLSNGEVWTFLTNKEGHVRIPDEVRSPFPVISVHSTDGLMARS